MSGSHCALPAIAIGTADRSPAVPIEDPVRKACTAEECRVHSACAGSERSQHRRRDDGGRARRRDRCSLWSRSASQVSLRVARQACTHISLTHCARHGRHDRRMPSQAAAGQYSWHTLVSMTSWPIGADGGAHGIAMLCFVSVRVATEDDRNIDLSQRVL